MTIAVAFRHPQEALTVSQRRHLVLPAVVRDKVQVADKAGGPLLGQHQARRRATRVHFEQAQTFTVPRQMQHQRARAIAPAGQGPIAFLGGQCQAQQAPAAALDGEQ